MPEDIADLEAGIRKVEPMLALHAQSPTAQPRVLPSLTFKHDERPLLFYYLVREDDLPAVVTRLVPAQGYWTVDVLRSPVVEFNSCYFDGRILRRGRLYYVDGFYGEAEAWIEKPESFRRWAAAVLKVARKGLKKSGNDYIGQETSNWLKREDGKLVP